MATDIRYDLIEFPAEYRHSKARLQKILEKHEVDGWRGRVEDMLGGTDYEVSTVGGTCFAVVKFSKES